MKSCLPGKKNPWQLREQKKSKTSQNALAGVAQDHRVTSAGMLIRKPVEQGSEAIVDPLGTTNFWFSKSSVRLEGGKTLR